MTFTTSVLGNIPLLNRGEWLGKAVEDTAALKRKALLGQGSWDLRAVAVHSESSATAVTEEVQEASELTTNRHTCAQVAQHATEAQRMENRT